MLKVAAAVVGFGVLASTSPHALRAAFSPEDLLPVDAPAVKRLIAETRGKVVALNFWATWCPPCLVEFPDLVALEKDYRARGLAVISVSADSPDEISSHVVPFLEKHQPGFRVYLWQPQDAEAELAEIDSEWTGSLPATFFIDREGKTTVKRFSLMSREEMQEIVEVLLGRREP